MCLMVPCGQFDMTGYCPLRRWHRHCQCVQPSPAQTLLTMGLAPSAEWTPTRSVRKPCCCCLPCTCRSRYCVTTLPLHGLKPFPQCAEAPLDPFAFPALCGSPAVCLRFIVLLSPSVPLFQLPMNMLCRLCHSLRYLKPYSIFIPFP